MIVEAFKEALETGLEKPEQVVVRTLLIISPSNLDLRSGIGARS